MRYIVLFLVAICVSQNLFGQIIDDFSDGNFSSNPIWTGDQSNFQINAAQELQLNATAPGTATLLTQGNIPDSAVWDFYFKLAFAPSGSNRLSIVLMSDNADLSLANGYTLEMGETGANDALKLNRLDAGVKTLLATGTLGLVATNPAIDVRVKRNVAGDWSIEAAPTGTALLPQLSVNDNTFSGGNNLLFGFSCVFTISNSTGYYFDNINIQPNQPDVAAPVLNSAMAINTTTIEVLFDEDLDLNSAQNPANYTLVGATNTIQSATLLTNLKTVSLTLSTPLATGAYTVQTNNVKDLLGNASNVQTAAFQYLLIEAAAQYDVIINEIMADPDPVIGLPNVEWLELFNMSAKNIDLGTLFIRDATGTPKVLSQYILPPGGYVVLTAASNVATLQAAVSGVVIESPLSTSALNNDGDLIVLTNANGDIINQVPYSVSWHTDSGKDDGGWSLERGNPFAPCQGSNNWGSCEADLGGTPGQQNSTFSNTPDDVAPELIDAYLESSTEITLTFSEGLDVVTAENLGAYTLTPTLQIASATLQQDGTMVTLTLAQPLALSTIYTLEIDETVTDCSGNPLPEVQTDQLGIPEDPIANDIVINEIMFNPATGGLDYIEFYNRSEKLFNWTEFFIWSRYVDSDGDTATQIEPIVANRLMSPRAYDVFTENADDINLRFKNINPTAVISQSLPTFPDDAGNVRLIWIKGGVSITIDSFYYFDDYHNALFSVTERNGVALERLSAELPSNAPSTWTSAATYVTGAAGTPTLPNSQKLNPTDPVTDELVTLPSSRISPAEIDGREDFLEIHYKTPKEGYAATITIFDADGVPVKKIVRQELIGTEGVLLWDGDQDGGIRVKPGIYILFVEMFEPGGDVRHIKKLISVVSKF